MHCLQMQRIAVLDNTVTFKYSNPPIMLHVSRIKNRHLNLAIFQYHADAENTATKQICKSLGVQGIIASSKKVRASPSRYY
jgi:hypothetical protein